MKTTVVVAADVLVTKAGPGTIAEAAAVGLPVMVTSFLPGQEAGNVGDVIFRQLKQITTRGVQTRHPQQMRPRRGPTPEIH